MLDEITSAIDATTDASSRKALRRCLPLLSEAISNWGGHALASGGLVIAGQRREVPSCCMPMPAGRRLTKRWRRD